MRKVFLTFVCVLIAAVSFQMTALAQDAPTTTVEFEELEWDFGEMNQGDKVTHNFKFTNTGSEPLILNSAKGSCGCTVPVWPKEPILPGEESEIEVTFNSRGKKGKQTKSVTLTGNTDPNPTRLLVKAMINLPETPVTAGEGTKPAMQQIANPTLIEKVPEIIEEVEEVIDAVEKVKEKNN